MTALAPSKSAITVTHRYRRSALIMLVLGISIAVLCEIFVFNLPYWQTKSLQEQTVNAPTLGRGMVRQENGVLRIVGDQQHYIEVQSSDDDNPIQYLRLNDLPSDTKTYTMTYGIITKQPNTLGWFSGGSKRHISSSDSRSRLVHIDGSAEGTRIEFEGSDGDVIPVGSITINPHIAFAINPLRLAFELLLGLMIAFLRPGSFLYRIRLRLHGGQLAALLTIVIAQLGIIYGVWLVIGGTNVYHGTYYDGGSHWQDYEQYARLADALIHGRTNLDLPVPDTLKQLINPYDPDIRNIIADGGKVPLFWDHAFYQGKYYSYFGVIPAVFLYMPYQIITGHWLSTSVAVLIFALLAALGLSWLVIMIARTLFPSTASIGMTILMMFAAALGSSLIYQTATPNFYSVPGVASLAFTSAGLCCWLAAKRPSRSINPWMIALGSLLIAANLGCRPQFVVAALLAFPLFWREIVHQRLFFSLRGLGNTIAAFAPFIIIAASLGWYNYIRFGSALNLGSNYNLTGFDMVNTRMPVRNTLLVSLYALFQPANLTAQFPFINTTQTPLPVWSPAEPSVGGLFSIAPFLLVALLSPWLLSRVKATIRAFACTALGLGVFVILFDSSLTGLAWRYYLDCAWLFIIATTVSCFACEHTSDESTHDWATAQTAITKNDKRPGLLTSAPDLTILLRLLILAAVVFSALFQFFALFTEHRYLPLINSNPRYYFAVAHWFLML